MRVEKNGSEKNHKAKNFKREGKTLESLPHIAKEY